MRLLPVFIASIGALGIAAACSPTWAQWDNDGWRRHEWHERQEQQQQQRWREHEWREHEWRERQRQSYYAPPPVIYSLPPSFPYVSRGYHVGPR